MKTNERRKNKKNATKNYNSQIRILLTFTQNKTQQAKKKRSRNEKKTKETQQNDIDNLKWPCFFDTARSVRAGWALATRAFASPLHTQTQNM